MTLNGKLDKGGNFFVVINFYWMTDLEKGEDIYKYFFKTRNSDLKTNPIY